MSNYIVRRLLAAIPVLFLVSCLVFIMLDLVPGDSVDALIGQTQGTISPEDAAILREQLGLNDPLPVRYGRWVSGVMQGDFGTSIASRQPVLELIIQRFPSTLQLTIAGMGLAIVLGFIIGILAALNRGNFIDTATMAFGMIGVSMPSFWLGLLLMLVFAVKFQWFPVVSDEGWRGLVLPMATLGLRAAAIISRLVRSSLIEVMSQDYIRVARAKGLTGWTVVRFHALKNTLIPIVTIVGLQFGSLLGGAIIVEAVFVRRGMGQLVINAIQVRDFPVVQGTILFIALVYVLVNLGVDLLYGFLDPRIRYG
ncbi:MAG: ABC transporter permease [Chloroflexota bacterium]|nr:ABC transporter permease [Chloroflexota bacterium]